MNQLICPPVYDICCCITSLSFLLVSWFLAFQGFLMSSCVWMEDFLRGLVVEGRSRRKSHHFSPSSSIAWLLETFRVALEVFQSFAAGTASCIHRCHRLLHGTGITNAVTYVMDHARKKHCRDRIHHVVRPYVEVMGFCAVTKCQREVLLVAFTLFVTARYFYHTLTGRLLHWSGSKDVVIIL